RSALCGVWRPRARTPARRAYHGVAAPAAGASVPPMKNAARPTSGIASAAARHTDADGTRLVMITSRGTRLRIGSTNDGIRRVECSALMLRVGYGNDARCRWG